MQYCGSHRMRTINAVNNGIDAIKFKLNVFVRLDVFLFFFALNSLSLYAVQKWRHFDFTTQGSNILKSRQLNYMSIKWLTIINQKPRVLSGKQNSARTKLRAHGLNATTLETFFYMLSGWNLQIFLLQTASRTENKWRHLLKKTHTQQHKFKHNNYYNTVTYSATAVLGIQFGLINAIP